VWQRLAGKGGTQVGEEVISLSRPGRLSLDMRASRWEEPRSNRFVRPDIRGMHRDEVGACEQGVERTIGYVEPRSRAAGCGWSKMIVVPVRLAII
jgi:hypothetical protein